MRLPLLVLHIAGGVVGLLSGTAAMVFRKGSRRHRVGGNVFVVSMLIMGSSASYLALMKHQVENFFGGLLTVYMIATAWSTARRRDDETSLFDWGALVLAVSIGTSLLIRSVLVARGLAAGEAEVPAGMYFFTAAIPLLAAMGDLRMLLSGISGTSRIARHLWRMCYGLFIATGSFFLGKQQFFPAAIRKQYLLIPLAVLPLVLLIYWLVRVRIKAGIRILMPSRKEDFQRGVAEVGLPGKQVLS